MCEENKTKTNSKKKFDREYSTTYVKEKQYLDSCGIRYVFVKEINGITTFKYEKTSELFNALANFFE